ncbi:LPXTG cell wall anchor domain-containing protein [Sphingorhabdus sp. M41]|nr:LPXTG cell wall anchor domain-containing protein [Sphingorhabdus sp. M41]
MMIAYGLIALMVVSISAGILVARKRNKKKRGGY